ncbi:MAG: (E)-4-hydroxy-3-methylbut-2-enyl-diphosphate synthase, partial [Ferruginibacter sp.]|nr:(E)-4-hydroxy-3-methylbut-2-enyl-diphosphate synthase [Ferruginibacter sp.]
MQSYCASLTSYKRLLTREVKIGKLLLGAHHPIRVQTMTTTDTMNTMATVEQAIRCIEAGAELIRITAPSKNEAENLQHIKDELRKRGYDTPLVADIHFTPNAAEIAARIVEKVRINPGNYVDKKKFEQIEYTDQEYLEEIDRIRERFVPLVKICKEHGTAMRIGTNHGSLSDRIMSRYGDTAIGMVESAMEFLRIARSEDFHNIVLSMKSSNPQVMVQAYRLLISQMSNEFGECYPLHLGVTEAGDGEDGRIKSAIGIGTLLEDGIGDTVRVSLTEDPEFEIPVCKHLVSRYQSKAHMDPNLPTLQSLSYDPFNYQRRNTHQILNIGSDHVPVVIADFTKIENITEADLESIGYRYDPTTDKWNITDAAADFLFCNKQLPFHLPGTLTVLLPYNSWVDHADKEKYLPVFSANEFLSSAHQRSSIANFVMLDCYSGQSSELKLSDVLTEISKDKSAVICLNSKNQNAVQSVRRMFHELAISSVTNPAIIFIESQYNDTEESLIHFAVEAVGIVSF